MIYGFFSLLGGIFMNDIEKITYYRKIECDEFYEMIMNKDSLLEMNDHDFNLFFLNINDTFKKSLIDEIEFFDKILSLPFNRLKKSILDLVSDDVRVYILKHPNLLKSYVAFDVMSYYISHLSCDGVQKILDYDVLAELFLKDTEFLVRYQNMKSNVDREDFSPIALFSIHNEYELLIYQRFHILVCVHGVEDDRILIGGKKISYSFLKNVCKKHIISLLDIAMGQDGVKNNTLFVTVIKLYMVFGYDNSKKILEQFFTYATDASIKRASVETFHDERRAYRLQNNHQFYFYGIEDYFDEALFNNDFSYFQAFCGRDDMYTKSFLKNVKLRLDGKEENERKEVIKSIILDEIKNRETYFFDIEVSTYQKYYESISRKHDVTIEELYYLFSNVDIDVSLSDEGKVRPNEELIKMFLGNCKRDNDCLLRMIFNRQALGLDEEIYHIINHFEELEDIVSRSHTLSLYSILDVIDISKVFFYHLKPDEMDISLETFLKILNSRKFCSEDIEVIIDRVKKLHKLRKFKISCAVPFLKGGINDVSYEIALPYDEKLLSSGIDTDSCFKVGGPGEDLFKYCLTNPLGCVLYLYFQNNCYVLPCTINGNMFNINGIEPKIQEREVFDSIFLALRGISEEIIDSTSSIELVTIGDFHHEDLMMESGLKSIVIDEFIPLHTDIYSDYNKKDTIHYILGKSNSFSCIKYFDNDERYYIKRFQPYVFSSCQEDDYERIEMLLNQIAYASIEFMDISEDEKTYMRENYQHLKISDFSYIVGNMDWFIGIDNNGNMLSYVLPFDDRGVVEYEMYCQGEYSKVKKRDNKY